MTKDLVILVPDTHIKVVVCALLEHRKDSLRIREVRFDCIVHPGTDGGVRRNAHELLRQCVGRYHNAVVLFDYHGCGEENEKTAVSIEEGVMSNLTGSGWGEKHACVVVIEPELEAWVWSDSPGVAKAVGWRGGDLKRLKSYVKGKGFQFNSLGKPVKPKEALEQILYETRVPRSASIYKDMARTVGLHRCKDRSFLQLKNFLCREFPK